MRRLGRRAFLIGIGCLGSVLAALLLWPARKPAWSPPISILVGVKEDEVREPFALRGGKTRRSRIHIYRLHMPKEDVMAVVRRELPGNGWYISTGIESGNTYMEAPIGFLELDRMTMGARKNKVDPETQAVLGDAGDSESWTTVTVYEAIPDRNVFTALWRWARRLTAP